MATLICMAVHSTEANKRLPYTKQCLYSLLSSVNFKIHKLGISDNASSEQTVKVLNEFKEDFNARFPKENLTIIRNETNLGTSKAVNKIIALREEGFNMCKSDDDVEWCTPNWVEEMEETLARQSKIGLVNLKRDDFGESPNAENPAHRTKLFMLPHKKHQRWIGVEMLPDNSTAMGTCQMTKSDLVDKLGGYTHVPPYGWDDLLWGTRVVLAGYKSVFLFYIRINHLDTGVTEFGERTDFIKWKEKRAGEVSKEIAEQVQGLINGTIPLYHDPHE